MEFDFDVFLNSVDETTSKLPKWQLEKVRTTVTKNYERRFRRSREPRYGSVNRAFTELELQHFLRNAPNEKFRLLFKFQAYLGLRVGEVCRLRVRNIDFAKRELTINSEKRNKPDSLLIPQDLFQETIEYVVKNEAKIKASNGHVFFKDESSNKPPGHLEPDYVRTVFRDIIISAGLNEVYATSNESDADRQVRSLHRLTTHSLRHYAITHFAKATNGNVVLASRFARHANPGTTMRYIAKDNEELYKNIDLAFSDQITASIKRLQSTFPKE